MLPIKKIHEEDTFLVIEKPIGVVVNRADSVEGETIQDWMENKFSIFNPSTSSGQVFQFSNKEEEEFINRSGVVHRLDKETSGLLILAKTVEAFQALKNQFKQRKTAKEYLALVHGIPVPKTGTINLPIKRNILNRHKFCVDVDGKMARSAYQIDHIYKDQFNNLYSIIRVNIFTGRTHQIRVHLSHLGYPIVSDSLYLGKRLKQDLTWCPRVFLHAAKLSFLHPLSGERLEFESKLPGDLNRALGKLI